MSKRDRNRVKKAVFKQTQLDVVMPIYSNYESATSSITLLEGALTRTNTSGEIPIDETLDYKLYLVDDASRDIKTTNFYTAMKEHPHLGNITYHKQNMGFGKSVNDGAVLGNSKYILVLSTDVMYTPGAIWPLYEQLETNPDIGITFPKLLFYPNSTDKNRPASKIQSAGIVFDIEHRPIHIFSGWDNDHPFVNRVKDMNACTGATFLIRRDLWRKLGGFDVVYGKGCLTGDSLIFTDDGLVKIKDLMGKDKVNQIHINVASIDEKQISNISFRNGVEKVYKLITEKRFEIIATEDHKIYIMGMDGIPTWKEISKLEKTDYVGIRKGANLWGKSNIDVDESYLLGLYTSEGNIDNNRICITNGDIDVHSFLLKMNFTKRSEIQYRKGDIKLIDRWKSYGVDFTQKAHQKEIPAMILQSDRETVSHYLSGLFDGDGCAKKDGKVTLTSSSYQLLRQTQLLLLNFGIVATITNKYPEKHYKNILGIVCLCQPSWTLELSHGSNIFYEQIGFRIHRKQIRQTQLRQVNNFDIPFQRKYIKALHSSITKYGDKKHLLANKLVYSKSLSSSYNSIGKILDIYRKYNDNENYKHLRNIIDMNVVWLKVKSVEKLDEQQTFDIHVPENHAYVANGMIVHNTWEDLSLCFRVRMAQYKIRYLPMSVGFHFVGLSAITANEAFPLERNQQIFMAQFGDKIPYDIWLYSG